MNRRRRGQDASRPSRRLETAVNVAILAVLAVLVFGPSGVVGSRAVAWYADWRQGRAVRDAWDDLAAAPGRIGAVPASPGRVVVEFVDYECPFCRQVASSVAMETANGGVTVVVRHLPLDVVHPHARSAARAAVCAERHGVFAAVHERLLAGDEWKTDDWGAWAGSLGIVGAPAFGQCVRDGALDLRIDEDARLAERIGVKTVPTFVTRNGVFAGAPGWRAALESLGEAAPGAQAPETSLATDVLFDSALHPDSAVSHMARVQHGLFVGADRIVVLDDATVLVVNTTTQAFRTMGGEGEGPGEFSMPWQAGLVATPDGFATWAGARYRLARYSPDGELAEESSLRADSFRQVLREPDGEFGQVAGQVAQLLLMASPPELLGVLADGAPVFWRSDTRGVGPEGLSRNTGAVFEYLPNDSLDVMFEFPTAEIHTVRPRPGRNSPQRVLFGHDTHVAMTSTGVVVADTQAEEIVVRARDGGVLWTIPMPGERVVVTREQVEAKAAGSSPEIPASLRASFGRRGAPAPHNPVAPPIDAVMTDRDGRVWVRDYVLPGAGTQRWTTWERGENVFAVELAVGEMLLDAQGDRVMVRLRDFERDRVQVRRIAY